jgi:RNA polymerase sigma factor for flagellar operon FliA
MHMATSKYQKVARSHEQNQLVLDHLEYVRHVVGKMLHHLPPSIDRENLESAGTLGLVEASKQFDADRGILFKTFAYQRIRGAILDELRRNSPFPQDMMKRITTIRTASESIEQPVTSEKLSVATGLTESEVEECLEAMRLLSVDQWGQSLPDDVRTRTVDASESLEKAEVQTMLAEELARLPEKERMVVVLYYHEDLRMKEIGHVLGLSESRISRLLAKAEFNLRETLNRRLSQ